MYFIAPSLSCISYVCWAWLVHDTEIAERGEGLPVFCKNCDMSLHSSLKMT